MARAANRGAKSKAQPRRLTPMQRLFALEYIVDLNGTKAAIRAGFSERTAAQQAHQLLQNPLVREEIDRQMDERRRRIRMDADRLLDRLCEEVDADIADIYNADGSTKPIHEWPRIFRQGLVTGMDVEELFAGTGEERHQVGLVTKPRFADRAVRIKMLGQHVGIQAWKERREIGVDQPLKELLREISGQSIRPKGRV